MAVWSVRMRGNLGHAIRIRPTLRSSHRISAAALAMAYSVSPSGRSSTAKAERKGWITYKMIRYLGPGNLHDIKAAILAFRNLDTMRTAGIRRTLNQISPASANLRSIQTLQLGNRL